MTKFYTFNQNNPGGRLHVNNHLDCYVIIEANTLEEAIYIAKCIGIYFNGVDEGRDCECCSDRWYHPDAYDQPSVYGEDVFNNLRFFKNEEIVIHYLNGTILHSANFEEPTT